MIEVTINYKTFALTIQQVEALNKIIAAAPIKTRKGDYELHVCQIVVFTGTRWAGEVD